MFKSCLHVHGTVRSNDYIELPFCMYFYIRNDEMTIRLMTMDCVLQHVIRGWYQLST